MTFGKYLQICSSYTHPTAPNTLALLSAFLKYAELGTFIKCYQNMFIVDS
jgi:hypothetical protein